jgi:hypothetical protein
MKRPLLLALVVLVLAGATIVGSHGLPPTAPDTADDAQRVVEAISDLQDPDYLVVRDAIRELNSLIDAPNIGMAVLPLERVLIKKDLFYSPYTRGMAARVMIRIAVQLGQPRGDRAVGIVIRELAESRNDYVRASCAYALGMSGRDTALEPLITANEDDPSPLVKTTACEALKIFTNGSYVSESCHYEDEEVGDITSRLTDDEKDESLEDEWVRYLHTHLLFPVDSLSTENSQQ